MVSELVEAWARACQPPLPIAGTIVNNSSADLGMNFRVSQFHSFHSGDCATPTVSAIVAPRAPSGFSLPTVVSRAV